VWTPAAGQEREDGRQRVVLLNGSGVQEGLQLEDLECSYSGRCARHNFRNAVEPARRESDLAVSVSAGGHARRADGCLDFRSRPTYSALAASTALSAGSR